MDKVCLCDGLNLLIEMMDVYAMASKLTKAVEERPGFQDLPKEERAEVYAQAVDGNPLLRARIKKLVPGLYDHLLSQTNRQDNAALAQAVQYQMDEFRKAVTTLPFRDAGFMSPLEIIRDRIHAHDELKQLMACGGPYRTADELTDGAQMIKLAMSILAGELTGKGAAELGEGPQAAARPLKEYRQLVTCGEA